MDGEGAVTQLLRRYNQGDRAAADQVIPLLYDDLRRLARQRLRSERPGHTLGPTALVNEFYLRLHPRIGKPFSSELCPARRSCCGKRARCCGRTIAPLRSKSNAC